MSITHDDNERPDPWDDPEAVIREELGPYREAIEALADLDMGVLSEDAEQALEILDQEDSE
jgi:hypothetical protein